MVALTSHSETSKLRSFWNKHVKNGNIKVTEKIDGGEEEIGLVLDPATSIPRYYATDKRTGNQIPIEIVERFIEGTDYVIQFNPFRCRRPGGKIDILEGIKVAPQSGIAICRFGCNDRKVKDNLLDRIPIAQVGLKNDNYAIYHNLYPIEEQFHGLYVRAGEEDGKIVLPHDDQILTKERLEDIIEVARRFDDTIVFYNSLHAGATVNHFHFQQVYHRPDIKSSENNQLPDGKFAIERAKMLRMNNRDILDYIVSGFVYEGDDLESAWGDVEKLQGRSIPFNLMVIGQKGYLIPRKLECEKVSRFSNVQASMEFLVFAIIQQKDFYDALTKDYLVDGLRETTYKSHQILDLVSKR